MRNRFGTLLAIAAIAPIAGCAAPLYEGRYSYDEGWREAIVTEVGIGAATRTTAMKDCRAEIPHEAAQRRRFVRVVYQYARHQRSLIAPGADADSLRPGDVVYVNTSDCNQNAAARSG